MNISEIFKKSFLEGFNGAVDTKYIVSAMAVSCLLAVYIFFVYRRATKKAFYSVNFNIALASIAVITAAIILTIQSSIVVSLGMVGALSIVRFRTAIKDPLDLMFLFWSICVGIICGAGLAQIAVIVSLILTAGLFFLYRVPQNPVPVLLVVNASTLDVEDAVEQSIQKYCGRYKIKSRSMEPERYDLLVEVWPKEEKQLLKDLSALPGVCAVSLVEHDGQAVV